MELNQEISGDIQACLIFEKSWFLIINCYSMLAPSLLMLIKQLMLIFVCKVSCSDHKVTHDSRFRTHLWAPGWESRTEHSDLSLSFILILTLIGASLIIEAWTFVHCYKVEIQAGERWLCFCVYSIFILDENIESVYI